MAIIGKEKYNQEKIDKLHDYLKMYQELGQPLEFEILVDGFKAVRRTSNIEIFRLFENFVNADTKAIEVLFFQGTSNNNDKHIFTMGEEVKENGLSGFEIDNRINEQVGKARKEWEFEQLKKDNFEWEEYAKELEEDVSKLEKELQEVKSSQSPLHGILGEFGSSLVSGIVRQNPKFVEKIPGLSGLLESSEETKDLGQAPGSDISFSSAEPVQEDTESREAKIFVKQIKQHYKGENFDKLMVVIDLLAQDQKNLESTINDLRAKKNGSV
jgi:hypothetical protein